MIKIGHNKSGNFFVQRPHTFSIPSKDDLSAGPAPGQDTSPSTVEEVGQGLGDTNHAATGDYS